MRNMRYLYGDSDSQSRGEVMSLVRKMVNRLRGIAYALHRMDRKPMNSHTIGEVDESDSENQLEQQLAFVRWFLQFLEGELTPSASYQHHIMALKSIEILLRSGVDSEVVAKHGAGLGHDQAQWPFSVSLHCSDLICTLIDLLLDPFEDVRVASSNLLRLSLDCVCEGWADRRVRSLRPGLASTYSQCLCYSNHKRCSSQLPLSTFQVNEITGTPDATDKNIQDNARNLQGDIHELSENADRLASKTNRADHADGAARLYQLCGMLAYSGSECDPRGTPSSNHSVIDELLSSVEGAFVDVGSNLDAPLDTISLHAHILSLKYIIQDPGLPDLVLRQEVFGGTYEKGTLERILVICQQVWEKVRQRLCVDSPENSSDDAEEDFLGGPKDILSYSWRALRDSSLLLRALLDSLLVNDRTMPISSRQNTLAKIGTLCMDQLGNLRHRGAFSTVAQTFSVLCQRIADSNDPSIMALRDLWYKDAMATLDLQAAKLTRRSAGIPAMISGLLTSCSGAFFNDSLGVFRARAGDLGQVRQMVTGNQSQLMDLPQVHALNCLREIFTNSKFRVITEPHLMDMLTLAATALSCEV